MVLTILSILQERCRSAGGAWAGCACLVCIERRRASYMVTRCPFSGAIRSVC